MSIQCFHLSSPLLGSSSLDLGHHSEAGSQDEAEALGLVRVAVGAMNSEICVELQLATEQASVATAGQSGAFKLVY